MDKIDEWAHRFDVQRATRDRAREVAKSHFDALCGQIVNRTNLDAYIEAQRIAIEAERGMAAIMASLIDELVTTVDSALEDAE